MKVTRQLSILLVLLAALSMFSACKSDDHTGEQPVCQEHVQGAKVIENKIDASCTTNGSYEEVTSCTLCGEELYREVKTVAALGHDMGSYVSNKNATCTEDGTKTRTCKNGCGFKETATDVGTAKGHVGTKLVSSDNETCNGKPIGAVYCAECGILTSEYGHRYVKSIVHPTCTKPGETRYTCSECGKFNVETIPTIDHVFSAWETTIAPTCHDEGSAESVCIICGDNTIKKAISKIPHSYDSVLQNNTLIFTCRECGDTKTEGVKKEAFTISFEENGGAELSDMSVDASSVPDLPLPVYDGHVFVGWYIDNELTTIYSGAAIHENSTFYAKWQKLDTLSDKEDIVRGVPLDYTFKVLSSTVLNENNIDQFIQIKTLSGESVKARATSLGNGLYEIVCDEYEYGTNYFITLLAGASFEDRETNSLWIITEGDREDVLQLKSGAIQYSVNHIYALSETRNGLVIVTYQDILDQGNIVAFYEDDMSAYRFGGKVLSKTKAESYYSYLLELYEVDQLFERCEVSHSTAIDFNDAELNINLEEEISEAFLSSDVYDQYVRAVSALSSKYGNKLDDPNFNIQFFPKGENFTIKLSVSAETDAGIVFTMDYYIDLSFEIDFALDGKTSTLVLATDMTNRVQLDIDGIHAFGASARSRLLSEYRAMFDMMKEKNALLDPGTEKSDVKSNEFHLATVPMKTGLVTVYLDLSANIEFAMMGGVSAELVHKLHSEIGIRGGNYYSDYVAKLVSINGCAYTGIDFYGGIGVALNVGFCGLTGYIKGTIGLHGELVGAAVLSITDNTSYALGDYNFDSEVLVDAQVGVKYEVKIFGFNKTYLDKSFTAAEGGFPFIEIGDTEIALHFTDNSNSTSEEAINLGECICDSAGFDISKRINTDVLILDIERFKIKTISANCEYTIVAGKSSANATITKDGKLVVSGTGLFSICISVKYGDVVEKEIYVKGNVVHDTAGRVMSSYTLKSQATCYSKAVYYISCSKCGSISGNGTFVDENSVLPEHKFATHYASGKDQHWIECTNYGCSEKKNVGDHAKLKIESKDYICMWADCTHPDIYYYFCNICNQTTEDTFEVGLPLPHEFSDEYNCHDRFCGNCNFLVEKTVNHNDNCGTCRDCHAQLYYFNYELINGEYAVSGTYIKCEDNVDYTQIGIPSYYNGKPITVIKAHAFENAENMLGMKISEGIKKIERAAFSGCKNLKTMVLPGTLGTLENGTFVGCESLETVTIGKGITKIGDSVFRGCNALKTVYFASSVTTIDNYAFSDCISLSTIYYSGTEEEWKALLEAHKNVPSINNLKKDTVTVYYNYDIQ